MGLPSLRVLAAVVPALTLVLASCGASDAPFAHALEGCGAAGSASWIDDVGALATALRASGVAQADGFALNVSNFETTERSVGYGSELSQRLDGSHFVIDLEERQRSGGG